MIIYSRIVLLWIVMLLFFACKKEKTVKNEDFYIEQSEQLSELKVESSSAGYGFIEVQWLVVTSTHFKSVTYSVYLDDQKIIDGLTTNRYSFINLKAGQAYSIKVIATTSEGKQIQQTLTASTLVLPPASTSSVIYREYSIHSYSSITGPTAVEKLSDGGHLVARLLQHPGFFSNETFKVLVFRTDKNGNMLWYRLLAASSGNTMSELLLAVSSGASDCVLFFGTVAVKLNLLTGEALSTKDYKNILGTQFFQSAYANAQQILVGTTVGSLLSVSAQNLNVNWHQTNTARPGSIVAINSDSKKNIYYIFRDRNDRYTQIRVHKCTPEGVFIKDFLFDGGLVNEYNYGFAMNALLVDDQDNLYMFGHNYDYNFLRYFKFTTDGTLIKKNEISDNLIANQAFFNSKGDIVVSGRQDGSGLITYGGIYTLDKNLTIKSKQFYKDMPYHIFRSVTGNSDGSYNIFLNYMQTYTYENSNFVFIKTDVDGKM